MLNPILIIIIIALIILFFIWLLKYNSNSSSNQDISFSSILSGNQQVPPVLSSATGTLQTRLSGDKSRLFYDLVVSPVCNSGLGTTLANCFSSPITVAHFNLAATGQNGPIVKTLQPFTQIFSSAGTMWRSNGIWTNKDTEPLTTSLVNALLNSNIAVTVQTQMYPNGEIRGQVRRLLT